MLDKNIKDTQVAKIYRDTLLYSNGRFNPVCFILAVNENFVFYNTLELNYHKNPLPLKANLDINETKGHYPAKMAYI